MAFFISMRERLLELEEGANSGGAISGDPPVGLSKDAGSVGFAGR
jgi:hypothetical protein